MASIQDGVAWTSGVDDNTTELSDHNDDPTSVSFDSGRDGRGSQHTAITSSVAETTIVTAIAATYLDVYCLIVSNSSASATTVTIKNATAGSTRLVLQVPAGDVRGFAVPAEAAMKQNAVNNNWTATCGTSVASVYVTALYIKNS